MQRLGATFDDHVIDRKNPRKITITYQNLYPESAERVCGNTYYVNLYHGLQIVQVFQVSYNYY